MTPPGGRCASVGARRWQWRSVVWVTAIRTRRRPARELYEELGRLPDRFRLPILLCHLEGLTYEQAAQQLGCPVRTVQSRLARARQRLRDRLTRRGVGPAVATLAAVLNPDAVSAVVSESWKHATVQAAVRYAASGASAAIVSATVAALAEGASRAMILHRLMKWAAFLLLIGVAAGGAGMAMLARSAPAEAERPATAGPDDNRYRVTMTGGATIEVVAVSTVPTGPDTWWEPDGSRLAEPPVDTIESKTGAHEGEVARVILVRASGSEEGRPVPVAPDSFRSPTGAVGPRRTVRTYRGWSTTRPRFPATGPIAGSRRGSPPGPGRPRCRTTAEGAEACS